MACLVVNAALLVRLSAINPRSPRTCLAKSFNFLFSPGIVSWKKKCVNQTVRLKVIADGRGRSGAEFERRKREEDRGTECAKTAQEGGVTTRDGAWEVGNGANKNPIFDLK